MRGTGFVLTSITIQRLKPAREFMFLIMRIQTTGSSAKPWGRGTVAGRSLRGPPLRTTCRPGTRDRCAAVRLGLAGGLRRVTRALCGRPGRVAGRCSGSPQPGLREGRGRASLGRSQPLGRRGRESRPGCLFAAVRILQPETVPSGAPPPSPERGAPLPRRSGGLRRRGFGGRPGGGCSPLPRLPCCSHHRHLPKLENC